ncbi:MAG: sulfite exporter TauE/SafE family protein, partial [Anaerolineaceae bacterium]|nr:sulfite exporter TauE/SafE family protein [Anaerolineaceae bacterium]
IGGLLLAFSGEKTFRQIVPFLILFASLLLAFGEPLKKWVSARNRNQEQSAKSPIIAVVAIAAAAVYGGYFGAGLSVIVLAFLGLLFDDSLTRLNALKQAIALATNTAAATYFLFSGKVIWSLAFVMAASALLGGIAGGKLAGRVSPTLLRWLVVSIGLIVSVIFYIQIY